MVTDQQEDEYMQRKQRASRAQGLPARFRDAALDGYVVEGRVGSRKGLRAAQDFADTLSDRLDRGEGLFFCGPAGTGKTMLSCALLNLAHSRGHSARFIKLEHYARMQRDIFELRSRKEIDSLDKSDQLDSVMRDMRNTTELLVVDDVGKEHRTDRGFVQNEFDFLLRHRDHNGLSTILTSNIKLSKWETIYNESMSSFIHEICTIVSMDDCDDYRVWRSRARR